LTIALEQLSVLQVVELIDGPTETGRCVVANRACDDGNPCALHAAWSQARDELVASLAAMSLADLSETRS
jgi:DNA-binding IscR family transcriptional regulator